MDAHLWDPVPHVLSFYWHTDLGDGLNLGDGLIPSQQPPTVFLALSLEYGSQRIPDWEGNVYSKLQMI